VAITEDTANQPVTVTWTGVSTTAHTTAAFTPTAGSLLVALVDIDGSSASGSLVTGAVTDSVVGTWTLLARQNTIAVGNVGGTAEVWIRYLPSAPGSMTVSVTGSGTGIANGGQLTVRSLLGAASTQSGNATAGATPFGGAADSVSVAAGAGNWIYGAAFNFNDSGAWVVLANTTAITATVDATNGDNWMAFKSSAATAGTATYGYSSVIRGMIVAAEVIAATAPAPVVISQAINRASRW
jgi:hypothetical protein